MERILSFSERLFRAYVDSGVWKCSQSPTGAHYWYGSIGTSLTCKYCGTEKPIDYRTTYNLQQEARNLHRYHK